MRKYDKVQCGKSIDYNLEWEESQRESLIVLKGNWGLCQRHWKPFKFIHQENNLIAFVFYRDILAAMQEELLFFVREKRGLGSADLPSVINSRQKWTYCGD